MSGLTRVHADVWTETIYRRRMRRLLITVTLFGCATPYQESGFSGGYENRRLSASRWLITVGVNSYTSQSTATAYAYRRASELCPGGFDTVDRDRSVDYLTINGQSHAKPSALLVVDCKAVAPTRVAAPPAKAGTDERKVIIGTRPIYCTVAVDDPQVGACEISEESCVRIRERLGDSNRDCRASASAACFNARQIIHNQREAFCSPSIKQCERDRETLSRDADYDGVVDRCAIFRMETDDSAGAGPASK